MQFLKQQNKRNAGKDPFANANIESNIFPEDIFATGKNVVVIGGGDTGSDCVGTSNRHGAKSVTQFELLPKPPDGRTDYMPWPTYPMILNSFVAIAHCRSAPSSCEEEVFNIIGYVGQGI